MYIKKYNYIDKEDYVVLIFISVVVYPFIFKFKSIDNKNKKWCIDLKDKFLFFIN